MWKAIKIYFRICEAIYAIIGVLFTFVCLFEMYYVGIGNWIECCVNAGNDLISRGNTGFFKEEES